jgi:hypothetical protein
MNIAINSMEAKNMENETVIHSTDVTPETTESPDRRSFLQGALMVAGAVAVGELATPAASAESLQFEENRVITMRAYISVGGGTTLAWATERGGYSVDFPGTEGALHASFLAEQFAAGRPVFERRLRGLLTDFFVDLPQR